MFYSCFNSLARYLSFFSFFFSILLYGHSGQQSPQFCKFSFFYWLWSGLVVWPILGDPFVCQNPIGVYVTHSPGHLVGCALYHCSYGQIQFSYTTPSGSPCPTQSYLVLYSFCAILLVLLIMWLSVSSLFLHKPTFTVLLHSIYSCFDIISSYGVV